MVGRGSGDLKGGVYYGCTKQSAGAPRNHHRRLRDADGLLGLDAVSFGPDIHDIHTPKEALDIESVKRTWEYILKVLEVI